MTRKTLLPVAVVMLMIAGLLGALRTPAAKAQDASTSTVMQSNLEAGELPVAPAFVRLLRITIEPDGVSPLHTHPGPEFNRVEQGTVRIKVQGKALLQRAPVDGVAQAVEEVPQDEEQVLRRGDQIAYMPGTAITFRNSGTVPAIMLAAVILPAGSQHPPGLVWVGQSPTAEDLAGVTSEVLGDGIATNLPAEGSVFTVEKVTLTAGQPLPAASGPTLYSLVDGVFDFTIQSGSVQVSRIAEPGPRPESPAGTAVSLAAGDAMFFPNGIAESARADASGEATFYRVSIVPAGDAGATPAASTPVTQPGGAAAVIAIAATAAPTPTPSPTAEATEAAATPEPTQAATEAAATETATAPAELANGVIAVANDDGVRVRDNPGTTTNVINSLAKGTRVRITGDSQEVDGIVWWPIEGVDDATIVGWASGEFLDPDANQQP
jgi:mannose-6-phosphate isomerase-like protein (cupin superfamily)